MLGLQPFLFSLVGEEQDTTTAASSFFPIVPLFHHCLLPSSFLFFLPRHVFECTVSFHFLAKSPADIARLLPCQEPTGNPWGSCQFLLPSMYLLALLSRSGAGNSQDATRQLGISGKCFLKELIMHEGENPFIKDFPLSTWKSNILFFPSCHMINACWNNTCLNLF